jgi:hypothetical protein
MQAPDLSAMNRAAERSGFRLATRSFLISVLDSYAALDLTGRLKARKGNAYIACPPMVRFAMGNASRFSRSQQ